MNRGQKEPTTASHKMLWARNRGKWARLVLLLGSAGAACYFLSIIVTIRSIAQSPIAVTPYVLQIEGYNFESNPNGELINRKTKARRTDGSTALIESAFGKFGIESGETTRKITLMDGRSLTFIDSLKVKTSWPLLSDRGIARTKEQTIHPPPNCVLVPGGETLVGAASILSRQVVMVRAVRMGDFQLTMWRDADLGCVSLQSKTERRASDGSLTVFGEGRLVSLKLEEPDPGLFEEGDNYEEVRPSEALRREAGRIGIVWDEQLQKEGERNDKRYFALFPQATTGK